MPSTVLGFLTSAALFAGIVTAQGDGIVYPTTASSGVMPVATSQGYVYAGCWNESTNVVGSGGARALGGPNTASNTMTVDTCLGFCGTNQYAGLEYGRECYCSPYLSTLSTKLNESECNFACDGNSSQICGGQLRLSLYNKTVTKSSAAAPNLLAAADGSFWYGSAALLTLMIAAIL